MKKLANVLLYVIMTCMLCHAQSGMRDIYNGDTIPVQDGKMFNARYCLTYDDFVHNRWTDAGEVRVKVKHGKKTLSSGKQEFKFKSSNRKVSRTLHDDALVVEADGQLFINQRHLYHFVSHFGNDYTRCFAVDSTLVFVGDMRFGDRPNELLGRYAGASSGRIAGGMTDVYFGPPVPILYIIDYKRFVCIDDIYERKNAAGVYCFMVNSNSINTVKLNENIQQILAGEPPTPVHIHPKDKKYLCRITKEHEKALKPASPYRQW